MNFGQATGLAAALAASEGIEPRDLDVKNLQQSLLRTPDITLVKNVTLHVHQMIGQVSAPGLAVVPTNPRLKSCALLTFLEPYPKSRTVMWLIYSVSDSSPLTVT